MNIRIGINGFGRIGRGVFRAALQNHPDMEIVAFNGTQQPDHMAWLLQHDTVFGRFEQDVTASEQELVVNGRRIRRMCERDPAKLDWSGVDVVIECTGLFLTRESTQPHLDAGAGKVMLSAPSKDATPMFVYGVNHERYAGEDVISNASCTTNCLAPVAKVLHDKWGIKRGLMTTVHAVTASQKTVDGTNHKNWRLGRSGLSNLIPSTTGAAKAVGRVLPELQGRLTGMSLRVPVVDVSVVDLTVELEQAAGYEAICAEMKAQSEGALKGVLGYTDAPVVSSDFVLDARSAIFDAGAGLAMDDTFVKLVAWYDNEWGYSNRCLDMARVMAA